VNGGWARVRWSGRDAMTPQDVAAVEHLILAIRDRLAEEMAATLEERDVQD